MLSFLSPYLTKIGVVVGALAVIVGLWLYVGKIQAELVAANAQVAAASEKCTKEKLVSAASTTAVTQAAVDAQHTQLDTAIENFIPASQANQNVGAVLPTITAQAVQPSQDAPIAPVLESAISAVRSAP